jgi:dTDP-4-dehydrorhamnose reductase
MSMALNSKNRSFSDLNQRSKNEGRNTSVMSRTASTGSLRRSSSTGGAPPLSRCHYIERIPLMLCAFFLFWNFRTNQLLVSKDAEPHNLSFAVPETLHPQETYIHKQKMTSMDIENFRGPKGPKYNVLVTGAAGFVGMFTCLELKRIGMTPIGYDNVNAYYSTELKDLRIQELKRNDIEFVKGDVCDPDTLKETILKHNITRVVHLAAQAGVRYSLKHPMEYTRNNVDCFVYLLETMVELGLTKKPLIFASSSSVYGNNVKIPFRESDRLEDPASLYAATKRSNELIAQTYFNLHNLKSIGLRFFTVYGPFGRPDMAPFIFADRISNNVTIRTLHMSWILFRELSIPCSSL